MAERELIDYIRRLAASDRPPWLLVGIGDDAAVLELPAGERIVATTDMVVEGVHYESTVSAALVGRKAMARSVSDIAAMAARPLCTLAAVNFGARRDAARSRELCRALWQAAAQFSAPLVGGDVAASDGPECITVTALGTPGPGGVVTRSGAQAGDAVCVTGCLGGSRRGRHLTFEPRVQEALRLVQTASVHAMIDISDGLSTDALHIAEASGVGVVLWAADIPVSKDVLAAAAQTGREPFWHALNDGEDYELLFCVPPADAQRLEGTGLGGVLVSVIGQVVPSPESWLLMPDGSREPLRAQGWEHQV